MAIFPAERFPDLEFPWKQLFYLENTSLPIMKHPVITALEQMANTSGVYIKQLGFNIRLRVSKAVFCYTTDCFSQHQTFNKSINHRTDLAADKAVRTPAIWDPT